ncbi:MAG TPA: membrane dipeptidase, partial [Candidatus Dormibacteraeota bacterium]|nr:membrane dipeptidase [Candidatus Dormibacteraeota bacterium]
AMSLALRELIGDRGTLEHRWIPELRAGGVDVQVTPIYVGNELPEAALRSSLFQLQRVLDEVDANADAISICVDGSQIDATLRSGRIAVVLALEGGHQFATDAGLVRTFYRLGVRMISFTHFGRTVLADGSAEDDTGGRLTRTGIAVFGEMERLGIVTDVSHLGANGVDHILELATRPVIASHSNARAVFDVHRNLSDAHIEGIAQSGGVVGVNFLPGIVNPKKPTIDGLLEQLDHLVEIAGIEHVGIGPDFIVDYYRERYPDSVQMIVEGIDARAEIPGLARASDLPRFTAALVDHGYTDDDVRKILGENFLRVFRRVMGIPGADALGGAPG